MLGFYTKLDETSNCLIEQDRQYKHIYCSYINALGSWNCKVCLSLRWQKSL